jgi:hypothetical protein
MTSIDLEPWLVVLGEPPNTSVAMWQLTQTGESLIALFSSRERASEYAERSCSHPNSFLKVEQTALIRVLADSYRQGVRHAALDPTQTSARQLFVLRDVLTAARRFLRETRDVSGFSA